MRFAVWFLAASALAVSSSNVRSETAVSPPAFLWGILVHPGNAARDGSKVLGLLEQLKVNSFRMDMKWETIEVKKHTYAIDSQIDGFVSQALDKGIHPLLVLCYGNPLYDEGDFPKSAEAQDAFVKYAQFVANHYKGRVKYYEIWNEYNHGVGTKPHKEGDPILYSNLLSKVYQGLKDVDSSITVLGGALARVGNTPTWTSNLFKAKALESMDGFSFHPYVFPDAPEKTLDELNRYEAVAKSYSNGREIPIYATELGWPTHNGTGGVTPDVAAMYLARVFISGSTYSYIRGMWWYELIDGGRDPNSREQNFGLFSGNQAAKPAACAMSQVGDLLTKYRPVSLRNTNGLWIAKFSSPGGNAFAAWTQTAGVTFNARIVAADPSGAAVLVKAICRDNGTTSPNSGTLSAAISNSPILFFTAAANLLVK